MIVEVKNLVKRYKEKIALDHFNMEVEERDILGLLGPNGSGKTTAISCILSLLKYDKGEIFLFGEKMEPHRYDLKRKIGIVPQSIAVYDSLTVQENVDYFCGLYIDDKHARKEAVNRAIDFVGLTDYMKYFPKKLSGGLERRLNIACGIAHKPKLLILDEPTVAVDAQSRNFILEGIKNLSQEGSTIIYTTHYMEEAEMLCNKISIIDGGRNIATGTTEELKGMISSTEKIEVEVLSDKDMVPAFQALPNVLSVLRDENNYEIQFEKGAYHLVPVIEFLERQDIPYSDIFRKIPTLNDVFLELTGKELRD